MPYRIEYMPVALEHLRRLSARDQRIVVDSVAQQLEDQPDVPTRNRKPLRPNDRATWELRIGELRVFYDILPASESEGEIEDENGSQPTVSVLAIGVKRGNRLFVGDEEIEL